MMLGSRGVGLHVDLEKGVEQVDGGWLEIGLAERAKLDDLFRWAFGVSC